ncbi:hypothetical protein A0H81_05674 [Grifola frondosa]|uniref:Uncharacterized protein n=1 Tax=Grifola frondosa TaxID=5627 RepID=A0A1C7MHV2_GRIFR|nr:hypothetical protein A0H81_05674 [Grifola frondosa]
MRNYGLLLAGESEAGHLWPSSPSSSISQSLITTTYALLLSSFYTTLPYPRPPLLIPPSSLQHSHLTHPHVLTERAHAATLRQIRRKLVIVVMVCRVSFPSLLPLTASSALFRSVFSDLVIHMRSHHAFPPHHSISHAYRPPCLRSPMPVFASSLNAH